METSPAHPQDDMSTEFVKVGMIELVGCTNLDCSARLGCERAFPSVKPNSSAEFNLNSDGTCNYFQLRQKIKAQAEEGQIERKRRRSRHNAHAPAPRNTGAMINKLLPPSKR